MISSLPPPSLRCFEDRQNNLIKQAIPPKPWTKQGMRKDELEAKPLLLDTIYAPNTITKMDSYTHSLNLRK
ncbi:hypothetical protein SLEP1_g44274 [Rubroshorea leprosula]|uniref:Uncharacterized protein n=1 Tax=Rubroshorea leprosula TaxID=152421 RepID=A0AAV5LFS6_9ROSI|nr:hypothetical protein SLEP1_g44274 [Rubroshorea leprosula]